MDASGGTFCSPGCAVEYARGFTLTQRPVADRTIMDNPPTWVKARDKARWVRAKEIAVEQYGKPLRYGMAVHVFRGMHDQSSVPRVPARDNPDHPEAVNRALDNYRMWHKRESESTYRVSVEYPDQMAKVGTASEVLYWSDKWRPRGEYELYRHKCDSHAGIYAPRKNGSHPTAELLGVANFRAKIPLTDLGFMEEATWRRTDGRAQTMGFPSAVVCSTEDNQALVIIREKGEPLIIKGGKMRVTAAGIVH
jgi:hypothetical protein